MFSKTTVKYIQSLQHKKFRDEHGCFIAEGPKVVAEFLEGNYFDCVHLYALSSWIATLTDSLASFTEQLVEVKDFELEKISALAQPNQVLGVFKKKADITKIDLKDKLTLLLDDIQDPGNLGTIIRNADWFGIENIICSSHTADRYNPKVVQSTMASLGRVNMVYTDLHEFIKTNANIPVYAAALEGKDLAGFYGTKEGLLIIGNESKGISQGLFDLVTQKITIPKIGEAESLNAAVATGIILYALTKK
ncbi:MAG: methyltransferase [Ferruginibacter sp.]|nr:methyltransferase [Ferruginibacter sp.]